MTTDPRKVRELWTAERAEYDSYRRAVEDRVRLTLREADVRYDRVAGRTKEIDSLVRKFVMRGGGDYADIEDRAGVRVVVRLRREVDPAVAAIAAAFSVPEDRIDDKRLPKEAAPDRFTYRAVHLDVRGDHEGLNSEKQCEVQVRTVCEDAWAIMSHFLAYKPEQPVPDDVRRSQAALSALMELADREYERQFDELKLVEGHDVRWLAEQCAAIFARLVDAPAGDLDVTEWVISKLRAAWGTRTPEEIRDSLTAYAEHDGSGFALRVAQRASAADRSAYLLSPEALLVAERITDGQATTIRELWDAALPPDELDALAWDLGLSLE